MYVLIWIGRTGAESYFAGFDEMGALRKVKNSWMALHFPTARAAYDFAGDRRVFADWRVGAR